MSPAATPLGSSARPSTARALGLVALSVGLGLAASCAVGPDYERPGDPLPSHYRHADGETPAPEPVSEEAAVEPAQRADWWNAFQDPELEALVLGVRLNNHELGAALERLDQARAAIGLARSAGRPAVALEPGASRVRTSDEVELFTGMTAGRTTSTFTLAATLAWELDVFGRVRRGTEASVADAEAAAADADAVQLLLETEAAAAYFTIRAFDLELDVVRQSVAARRSGAELVRRRFELGAVSELDASQTDALLAQSEAELAGLLRARSAAEHGLAVLVGEPATSFELAPSPLAGRPPEIPAGLPSELLRARPDIRRAERMLAAENARIGIATAAFYPSFTLTGDAGWQATHADDLLQESATIWGLRPSVYLPLFQGRRNRDRLERARARYEEVAQNYQHTVLVALAEVETGLAARRHLTDQAAAQTRAASAAARARELATAQYEGGTVDYLNVLDAERTALDAERARARLLGEEFVNTLLLLRALGGRW